MEKILPAGATALPWIHMARGPQEGRVALVTGASRGIGRAIALRLGREGAAVLCASRSSRPGEGTVEELRAIGVPCAGLAVDAGDPDAVRQSCEAVLRDWGRVDILVHCAGISRDNLLLRMGDEEWNSVLRTDLDSCFLWTRHLCRSMLKGRWGRIIAIGSVVGLVGNAGQANYAAAKAGMVGFIKSVARELAPRGITANAVAPGFIETAMTAALGEGVRRAALDSIPQKTFGTAEDVAAAVSFLASEEARYITGQVLAVDGGMTMVG
ncbi:MAG: 3-oxoacyl-[acyl-carrier-protein] reductase [Puniceicoccales bacterium]|nr:3-oxoacyl-[acyl-carrier-protein] reductase [Puniceicoccales bacterium]